MEATCPCCLQTDITVCCHLHTASTAPADTVIKQSHYSPGQTLSIPGKRGSQISRQSVHDGGKVVSPTNRPPLTPENTPGTHLCCKVLRYKSEGRWFDSRWYHWNFSLT